MKKISIRQTAFVLILLLISMRVIIEPSFMFSVAGKDGFASYLIGFLIQVVGIVFIALLIKNNPNKKFSEICEQAFGKAITKIIMVLFFAFFALKITGIDFEVQNFLLEVFYEKLYSKIFLIPFFLVIVYVSLKGPRIFARLSEVFLPFGVFVLFYTLIIAIGNAKMINLLPIFADGAKPFINGTAYGVSQMGEFLALFFLMENVEIKRKEKAVTIFIIVAIVFSIFMTGFYLLFVAVFGNASITLNEGIIRMTQFSTSLNINFRIDGLSAVMWLPLNVILLCVNFYCAGKTIQYIFDIKLNFAILIVFVLFFIVKFMPAISSNVIFNFEINYFIYVSVFLQIILPALLFIIIKIKKGKSYEKNFKFPAW